MKLCIVFWGESYRSGPQISRLRGTNDYIKRQILASKSHISLINSLKEKGVNIDTILNTYKLNEKDDNNLMNYYKNFSNLISTTFNNNIFPSESDFLNNMYDNVTAILDNYDFILFIRIDLYLKKYFIENVKLDINRIQFAHIDSNQDINNIDINIINICQQIMIFPKSLYYTILNKYIYNSTHGILSQLTKNGITYNSIGFIINTMHICSTDLGWNPLYIQVGRNYNGTYSINGASQNTIIYYYDIYKHKFINDMSYVIKQWEPYLNTDTLEDNMILLNENNFEDINNI